MKTSKTKAFLSLEMTERSLSKKIDNILDEFPREDTRLSLHINNVKSSQIMILYSAIMYGIIEMKKEITKGSEISDATANSYQDILDIIESFKIIEGEFASEVTKKKDELVLLDYLYRIIPKNISAEKAEKFPWISMKPVCEKLNVSHQEAIDSIMELNDNEEFIVEFRPVYTTHGAEISTQNPYKKG